MKLEQISIFLENKTGRINEVANVLNSAGINMHAFSLSESSEFGIMRIILSDCEKAAEELRKYNFMVTISEVICMQIDNKPGSMAEALNLLTSKGILIEYMYAFSRGEHAYVVLRSSDMEATKTTLNSGSIKMLSKIDIEA